VLPLLVGALPSSIGNAIAKYLPPSPIAQVPQHSVTPCLLRDALNVPLSPRKDQVNELARLEGYSQKQCSIERPRDRG